MGLIIGKPQNGTSRSLGMECSIGIIQFPGIPGNAPPGSEAGESGNCRLGGWFLANVLFVWDIFPLQRFAS